MADENEHDLTQKMKMTLLKNLRRHDPMILLLISYNNYIPTRGLKRENKSVQSSKYIILQVYYAIQAGNAFCLCGSLYYPFFLSDIYTGHRNTLLLHGQILYVS